MLKYYWKGADVNAVNTRGYTALSQAIVSPSVAKILLDHGADANITDIDGGTPLIFASYIGDTSTVSYLLDAGADVNAKELRGLNPLILAVSGKGNIEIVSMLLEKGADVNANDCHGFTALMSARWKKHKEIVPIIKRYMNRTISLVIKKGRTKDEKPLMSSAHIETIYRISSFF